MFIVRLVSRQTGSALTCERMFAGRGARVAVRLIDFLAERFSAREPSAEHLRVGVREKMKLISSCDEWVT